MPTTWKFRGSTPCPSPTRPDHQPGAPSDCTAGKQFAEIPPRATTVGFLGSPSAEARTVSPNRRSSAGTGTSNSFRPAGGIVGHRPSGGTFSSCGRGRVDSPLAFLLEPVRSRLDGPLRCPLGRIVPPRDCHLARAGRLAWNDRIYWNRRPTLDASAPPKESALDPKYAAVQLNVKLFLKLGGTPPFEPEAAPRWARMSAHQGLGEVGLAAIDRVDHRVVLVIAGHQDPVDFLEWDSLEGHNVRRNERHRIDAMDEVAEQRIARAVYDQIMEAAVHARIGFLIVLDDVV